MVYINWSLSKRHGFDSNQTLYAFIYREWHLLSHTYNLISLIGTPDTK